MNQDNGKFVDIELEKALREEPTGKVFAVGEVLKIKESYFKVHMIRERRMNLKLLPTARGKELYEAANPHALHTASPAQEQTDAD